MAEYERSPSGVEAWHEPDEAARRARFAWVLGVARYGVHWDSTEDAFHLMAADATLVRAGHVPANLPLLNEAMSYLRNLSGALSDREWRQVDQLWIMTRACVALGRNAPQAVDALLGVLAPEDREPLGRRVLRDPLLPTLRRDADYQRLLRALGVEAE